MAGNLAITGRGNMVRAATWKAGRLPQPYLQFCGFSLVSLPTLPAPHTLLNFSVKGRWGWREWEGVPPGFRHKLMSQQISRAFCGLEVLPSHLPFRATIAIMFILWAWGRGEEGSLPPFSLLPT